MDDRIYFRRCHICGGLNEHENEQIERCEHCGKALAPFYFFNEIAHSSDPEKVVEVEEGEFQPIVGLTVYW